MYGPICVQGMSVPWHGSIEPVRIEVPEAGAYQQSCKQWVLRVLRFGRQIALYSAKFKSLNVQIWNNFNNTIFTACKWCKLFKYYANSMVLSCSTCQRRKLNALGLNMFFRQYCHDFYFVVIYAIFAPNPYSQIFRIDKKKCLLQLWLLTGSLPTLHFTVHSVLKCTFLYSTIQYSTGTAQMLVIIFKLRVQVTAAI